MYPSSEEKEIVQVAEKLMIQVMSRYDPSHDKFHGAPDVLVVYMILTRQFQFNASEKQP